MGNCLHASSPDTTRRMNEIWLNMRLFVSTSDAVFAEALWKVYQMLPWISGHSDMKRRLTRYYSNVRLKCLFSRPTFRRSCFNRHVCEWQNEQYASKTREIFHLVSATYVTLSVEALVHFYTVEKIALATVNTCAALTRNIQLNCVACLLYSWNRDRLGYPAHRKRFLHQAEMPSKIDRLCRTRRCGWKWMRTLGGTVSWRC